MKNYLLTLQQNIENIEDEGIILSEFVEMLEYQGYIESSENYKEELSKVEIIIDEVFDDIEEFAYMHLAENGHEEISLYVDLEFYGNDLLMCYEGHYVELPNGNIVIFSMF